MMKETKGTFMRHSRVAYLLSMHSVIVDRHNKCKALLARAAATITVEQEQLLFTRCVGVLNCDGCGQKVGL